jgi:hypothetical protein
MRKTGERRSYASLSCTVCFRELCTRPTALGSMIGVGRGRGRGLKTVQIGRWTDHTIAFGIGYSHFSYAGPLCPGSRRSSHAGPQSRRHQTCQQQATHDQSLRPSEAANVTPVIHSHRFPSENGSAGRRVRGPRAGRPRGKPEPHGPQPQRTPHRPDNRKQAGPIERLYLLALPCWCCVRHVPASTGHATRATAWAGAWPGVSDNARTEQSRPRLSKMRPVEGIIYCRGIEG